MRTNSKLNHTLLVLIFTMGIGSTTTFAQDTHFTQYDASPTLLNPALTGAFNGDFRAIVNHRKQWGTVGKGYRTFSFSADGGILKKEWKKGYLGLGMNAYRDVAGAADFAVTNLNLNFASIIYLDDKNTASVGMMGGFAQNSVSADAMQWDAQFDGTNYNSALPSNEGFLPENVSYFDFAAGAMWIYGKGQTNMTANDQFMLRIGATYHHLSKPELGFTPNSSDPLHSRFAVTCDVHYGVRNTNVALRPKLYTYLQGPNREIQAGFMTRMIIQEESKFTGLLKEVALSLGGYYRVGDALSPALELEVSQFAIGFSYDFTLSSMTAYNGGRGGAEIFVRFINPNPFRYGRGTKGTPQFN